MKISILFQRLEAVALLAASFYFYYQIDYNWLVFVVSWFAIDLSMAGYIVNNRAGAYLYNTAHSLLVPAVLFIAGYAADNTAVVAAGLIFLAHIGLDRALGYGLKNEEGFTHTHLGMIGKKVQG